MLIVFIIKLVEEEQARDRYLRRFGDRQNVLGSTCSTISAGLPCEPLLSPGLEPISVPVPPPPSPEVPHLLSSLQQDFDLPEVK